MSSKCAQQKKKLKRRSSRIGCTSTPCDRTNTSPQDLKHSRVHRVKKRRKTRQKVINPSADPSNTCIQQVVKQRPTTYLPARPAEFFEHSPSGSNPLPTISSHNDDEKQVPDSLNASVVQSKVDCTSIELEAKPGLLQHVSLKNICEIDSTDFKKAPSVKTPARPTATADAASPVKSSRSVEKVSRFFLQSPKDKKKTKKTKSNPESSIAFPRLLAKSFGLIQELLSDDPFQLLLAVNFLNKTKGIAALPAFWNLTERFATPKDLADASTDEVVGMIHHLGLQNTRAKRVIALANTWLNDPPVPGFRRRTLHYPYIGAGRDIGPHEVLGEDDKREGAWEIAHLPGVGAYALDSWRIFCRDKFRGVAAGFNGEGANEEFEPEWKRVLPRDKELRAFLCWMWLREGWKWNALTGEKIKASQKLLRAAQLGAGSWTELITKEISTDNPCLIGSSAA